MISRSKFISHINHASRPILRSLWISIGFFLFLFSISHIAGSLYIHSIASDSINLVKSGIDMDTAHLKFQGDEIAKSDKVIDMVLEGNSQELIKYTKNEIQKRSIGLMGIANAEGVILSRTLSSSNLGENVFLTIPAGRVVAQGKSIESIELTGFGNQLFITTTRPIIKDGKMVGALFANYLTNDEYAKNFRDKYLIDGTEIVFYTKKFGVYGNSFSDSDSRELVNSYFTTGSEWISDGVSGRSVSFGEGKNYLVENIVFPGIEQSPGGVLIFIPRADFSTAANFVISLLTTALFIYLAFKFNYQLNKSWLNYSIIFFFSFVVFCFSLVLLRVGSIGFIRLQKITYPLYNSTIRLQPESGVHDMGFNQRVTIMVDTGDESINAVEVGINFDQKKIEIKDIDVSDSVCSYVIESIIDNDNGKINLSCVLLNDLKSGSLKVADLVISAKNPGLFTLYFDKQNTKVLANDGLGTDVLREAQSGSYRVETFTKSEIAPGQPQTPFIVFSPSHPNQSRWYNSTEARFVWKGEIGAIYKYAFDSNPDTVPSNEYTTKDSFVIIPVPGDGIFYFHLQLATGGPIAHYAIKVDRTPPTIIRMRLSSNEIFAGDVVMFLFEGEDRGSGIQKNYYVDLGNRLFLPIGQHLFVPFLDPGNHKIKLRVYDDAGNYSEKQEVIHVKEK